MVATLAWEFEPMPKRKIEDMVKDKYADPEVQRFILDDVHNRNTGEKIERGELVLPSEEDAERNLAISKGEDFQTERERQLVEENKRLKAQSQQPASPDKSKPAK